MDASRVIIGSIYQPVTREYVAPIRLHAQPGGSYPLPDNVVALEPPGPVPPNQAFVLSADGNGWTLCADYRQAALWNTATAMPAPNRLTLGATVPIGLTTSAPLLVHAGELKQNKWDAENEVWYLIDVGLAVPPIMEIPPEDHT